MIADVKCKKCRAKGEKLFLKGERCFSTKCSFLKRASKGGFKPGARRPKPLSEYGRQLMEKQKAKLIYGISEGQLKKYFEKAAAKKGSTGEILFALLEKRLDNLVFRAGFAGSRSLARQMVSHGHFLVNGRKSKIASRQLKAGDIISIRSGSLGKKVFSGLAESLKKYSVVKFISLDRQKMEGKLIGEPNGEELKPGFNISLIVEFYSK